MSLRRPWAALLLLAFVLPACLPSVAAVPRPPQMRLGDAVRPLAYELELTLVPTDPGYEGRVDIEVDLRQPTRFFWINGRGLDVRGASIDVAGRTVAATATPAGKNFIGLSFAQPLPAGKARLTLAFRGTFATKETLGLFRQQDRGDWYAFSQFEADSARRAFPSFDEPHWKTPWTLTLNVRREHVAVANTEIVSEEPVGTDMKRVRFARTLPLPSYLVAMGVGPFDVVDGGTAGVNKTPLRYIVPRGRGAETRYVRESTPKLLALLEDYFGRPYPYSKLDSLTIPVTVAFGAMENPGLITYRSNLLLSTPEMEDERFQQRYAGVGAHEMAHQWFGDLVTMQWWTDIWLNESFATWMARKVVQRFNPAWESHAASEFERTRAFQVDRLSSTRQIRQEVRTEDDLGNVFDRITYDKGGAVLTMFEAHMGETAFRDGVRRYLGRHAFGNASAEDFFAALSEGDPEVAQGFASFVSQPGLPLVRAELACTGATPAVKLTQQRFTPARPAAASAQRWRIPVCMRLEGRDQPFCTTLDGTSRTVELPVAACPGWVLPNPGGAGYFLAITDAQNMRKLAAAPLGAREAASLVADLSQLAQSGALPAQSLLEVAGSFAADPRPEVAKAAAGAVAELHPARWPGTAEDRAAWVRERFAARAAELGWVPRAGESDAIRRLRSAVLPLVVEEGNEPQLRRQARELAMEWLGGNRGGLGAMYRNVLRAAAHHGDAALFDAMVAAVRASNDGGVRTDLYKALGRFREPGLRQKAFELALSDTVDLRESIETYESAGFVPDNSQALLRYVQAHFPALERRLPEELLARLPRYHNVLCAPAEREAMARFYARRITRYPGGARNLSQALERTDICIAGRAPGAGARHAGL